MRPTGGTRTGTAPLGQTEAVAALKSARAPELAEQIDDLQDAILTAQGKIFAAIDKRFAPFESQ